MVSGQTYYMRLDTTGVVTLVGAAPINESDFDDGLPLRYENYDGFGGLYQGRLNLQIYWDDNADKLTRFVNTLSQGDYIFMSSNRQWAIGHTRARALSADYCLLSRPHRLPCG